MPFKLKRLKLPKIRGREREEKEVQVKIRDEWQILCEDPKYYQNLPKEKNEEISEIQQGLYHDLMRLPFEEALDERKTIDDLLKEAEELKKEKKYSEAAERYRRAATLGLFRKEIREKIDPKATDVKTEDVIAYLKLATELGYLVSYSTVMGYPQIAREIASDKLKAYQPKVVEKKKEVGKLVEGLK